jgi:hypothetical protein
MKLQERIEKMEKELAELKASVVAQSLEWPSVDDSYWTIIAHGAVLTYRFCDDEFDRDILKIGNIFRTEEEAERGVERLKVLTQLRNLAKAAWGGVQPTWPSEMEKWYVQYFHGRCEWLVSYTCHIETPGIVYFPSEKSIRDAIKTVGADRMMLLLDDWTSMKGAK